MIKNKTYIKPIVLLLMLVFSIFGIFFIMNNNMEMNMKKEKYTSPYLKDTKERLVTNSKYDYQKAKNRVLVKADNENFENYGGEIELLENNTYLVSFNSQEEATNFINNSDLPVMEDDVIELQSFGDNFISKVFNIGNNTQNTDLGNYIYNQDVTKDEVTVAILDTGYSDTNTDGRILEGINFSSTGESSYKDDNGHGTKITEIILNDTFSNVKVMPVKVLDSSGHGTLASLQRGLRHAIDNNVDIINISLVTKSKNTGFIEELIKEANEKGIIVIASAGNYGDDVINYSPANIDSVVTVSSVDQELNRKPYANYGSKVDYSSIYEAEEGTSFSTAKVTAIYALMKGINKEYTITEIEDILDKHLIKSRKAPGKGVLTLNLSNDNSYNNSVLNKEYLNNWKELSGEQIDEILYASNEYDNAKFFNSLSKEDQLELIQKSTGYLQNTVTIHDKENEENIQITKFWETLKEDQNKYEYFYLEQLTDNTISAQTKVLINKDNKDNYILIKKLGDTFSITSCEILENQYEIKFAYDYHEGLAKFNSYGLINNSSYISGDFIYCDNHSATIRFDKSDENIVSDSDSALTYRIKMTSIKVGCDDENDESTKAQDVKIINGIRVHGYSPITEYTNKNPINIIFDGIGRYQFNYTAGSSVRAYLTPKSGGGWNVHAYDVHISPNKYDRKYEQAHYYGMPGNSSGGYLSATTNGVTNTSKNIKKAYLMISSSADNYTDGNNFKHTNFSVQRALQYYNVVLEGPKSHSNFRITDFMYNFWSNRNFGYVDVTDFVKENGYGWYYCYNVPYDRSNQNEGLDAYAGWKLFVIEENDELPIRAMKLNFCNLLSTDDENTAKPIEIYDNTIHAKEYGEVTGQLLYSIDGGDNAQYANEFGNFVKYSTSQTANLKNWDYLKIGTRIPEDILPRMITRNGEELTDNYGNPGYIRYADNGYGRHRYYASSNYYFCEKNSPEDNMEAFDVELVDVSNSSTIRYDNNFCKIGLKFWTAGYCLVGTTLGINYDIDTPEMYGEMQTIDTTSSEYNTLNTKITGMAKNNATNNTGYANANVIVNVHECQVPTTIKGTFYNASNGTTTNVTGIVSEVNENYRQITFKNLDFTKNGSYLTYEIDCDFDNTKYVEDAYNYATLNGYYSYYNQVSKEVFTGTIAKSDVPNTRYIKIDPNTGKYNNTEDATYVKYTNSAKYFVDNIQLPNYTATYGYYKLLMPEKYGYDLESWEKTGFNTQSYGIYTPAAIESNNFATFKAKWSAVKYNIKYDLNKPENATHEPDNLNNPTTATYDTPVTIKNPLLTGWEFTGWTITDYDKTVAKVDGQKHTADTWTNEKGTVFENLCSKSDDTVTFTANWKPITYTISLYPNKPEIAIKDYVGLNPDGWNWNETNECYDKVFTYDSEEKIPSVSDTYSIESWDSYGWYDKENGGKLIGDGTKKWNLTTIKDDIISFYVQWKDNIPPVIEDTSDNPETNPDYSIIDGIHTWEWTNKQITLSIKATDIGSGIESIIIYETDKNFSDFVRDQVKSVEGNGAEEVSISYDVEEGERYFIGIIKDRYGNLSQIKYHTRLDMASTKLTEAIINQETLASSNSVTIEQDIKNGLYTTFSLSMNDTSQKSNVSKNVSGLKTAVLEVWDSENPDILLRYNFKKTINERTANESNNILDCNLSISPNLYADFKDSSLLAWKIIITDNAKNTSEITSSENIINYSSRTFIYNETKDSNGIEIYNDTDDNTYFKVGEIGRVEVYTIGYTDNVSLDFDVLGEESAKEIADGRMNSTYRLGTNRVYDMRQMFSAQSNEIVPDTLDLHNENDSISTYDTTEEMLRNSVDNKYSQHYVFTIQIPPYYQLSQKDYTREDGLPLYNKEIHTYKAVIKKDTSVGDTSNKFTLWNNVSVLVHYRITHES